MNQQDHSTERLHLLPWGDDPLQAIARTLLHEHRNCLPRLEHVTVLLPELSAAPRLRQLLLAQAAELGHTALLGPQIDSWRSWLKRYDIDRLTTVSDYRRELILLGALRQHGELFGQGNLWALADSLLSLFDELTLNQMGLPRDLKEFTRRLAAGYGLTRQSHDALDREAQLVHTLWHAWHDELHERGLIDRNTRHLLQLAASAEALEGNTQPLYLLPPVNLCHAERVWLGKVQQNANLTLFLQGKLSDATDPSPDYHPEAPLRRLIDTLHAQPHSANPAGAYSRLLDAAYQAAAPESLPLRERAARFATEEPQAPLATRLKVYGADSDEEEANAVELQVRRWLLSGHRRIGIVTENRRLARRVRALLERAGISLEDAAGWALSTTSAAAVVERWLQCIEEDFPYRAMLDLLKSPFFTPESERETHLEMVYRLEQDVVLHENIGSGIERYRQHLEFRRQRLPDELGQQLQPASLLLDRLQQAAAPLQGRLGAHESEAGTLLTLLQRSLDTLGITAQLSGDAAGMRLLEELQKMQQAVAHEALAMDWLAFRNWLGRSLERYNFQPPTSSGVVSLSGLAQTPASHFDSLIIAAVEREHLPGSPAVTPFFNDAVRRQLGLPTAEQQLAERYYHFRRLLEAAPQLLLTHRRHHNGEEVAPSPWLELLQAFHRLAYNTSLADDELTQLLAQTGHQVVDRSRPLPPRSRMPQPTLAAALIPGRYSASAYQQLLNCPYQFFAARALGLAAPEAIREALEKSDYGERVHRCLQAMHGDVAGLPGPYTGGWEAKRRTEAIALLEKISHAVFAQDLEDNFLHRGWLQRWLGQIPHYIDWQLERAQSWRVQSVEQQVQQEHSIAGVVLHGRLDRCDSDGEHLAIVDYKTGQSARDEEILAGEAIQLPFYALLAANQTQTAARVEYLSLDEARVTSRSILQEPQLSELSHAVGARLAEIQQQMHNGAGLPAWGDEKSCEYCQMSAVCRRQAWERDAQENTKGA